MHMILPKDFDFFLTWHGIHNTSGTKSPAMLYYLLHNTQKHSETFIQMETAFGPDHIFTKHLRRLKILVTPIWALRFPRPWVCRLTFWRIITFWQYARSWHRAVGFMGLQGWHCVQQVKLPFDMLASHIKTAAGVSGNFTFRASSLLKCLESSIGQPWWLGSHHPHMGEPGSA